MQHKSASIMNGNQELHALLAKSTWIGFDLDDTLHEFRHASAAATGDVLRLISAQYGTDMNKLQASYAKILKDKTANAFSDGRTSTDYRKERFTCLLNDLSLPHESDTIARLLLQYQNRLAEYLQLKAGALEVLSNLKARGKKIVVVTEGPQDGQEWTLQQLGLAPLVDVLVTTSAFKTTKVDGLFGKVLEHLGVAAKEVVFVGDNYERDVLPAREVGILAIHYAEGSGGLDARSDELKVATLEELRRLFE